jgi:hypothetical protein
MGNLPATKNKGMFIYNVTIKVDWQIAEAWKQWMINEHIPQLLETGCFEKHVFVRLLEVDETEGPTYAAQYYAPTRASLDTYLNDHAATLRQDGYGKWGDKFIAFRTIMEIVN